MKKLLCVLLFGMVFGQALIETREYELMIYNEWGTYEIYFDDYDDFFDALNLTAGNYTIELIGVKGGCDIVNFDTTCEDWDQDPWIVHNIALEYFILGSDSLNYGQLMQEEEDIYIHGITISKGCDQDYIGFMFEECEYEDVAIKLWISGQFDDTDVGLNGDMNDDNSLDVLDVVLLVQEILGGGMGDVGDLLNIVTG